MSPALCTLHLNSTTTPSTGIAKSTIHLLFWFIVVILSLGSYKFEPPTNFHNHLSTH